MTTSNAMNNRPSSSRADTRRDRFPWLLAAGPAIVVVASFVTFAIAATHGDRLVASNYYKLGLTINRKLAADPVRIAEGEATVSIDPAGGVRVALAGVTAASVALLLHSPGDGGARPIALSRTSDGNWTGSSDPLTPGRKIVALSADGWQFPVTVVTRLPATVHLHGESAPSS